VLLEGDVPSSRETVPNGTVRRADIRSYEPNRVVVDVESGPAGWLVLADLWYPGWICWVDDKPVAVQRAYYAFRAVAVPEGRREVVFTFEPDSYRWGRRISLVALAAACGILTLAGVSRYIKR
jgi:uncharacterized membrane protein YfhO